VGPGDVADLREDHAHGALRHRPGVSPRGVHHGDPAPRGARNVDVLGAAAQQKRLERKNRSWPGGVRACAWQSAPDGATDVVLRNVRGVQGAAADVFHVYGASGVEMYHCIAEATTVNAVGFHVGDTSVVYMDDCTAYDSTNFADALLLDASLCAVISRWCTFVGSGDDVQTGANSVWYYLNCYFYPTNVTLAAGTHFTLPAKRFNQTVIVAEHGGDFQALSEAITYINAQGDAAAAKRYGVLMLSGNFAEAADVTIPPYVNVSGEGESTRIEMGVFTLIMSNNTGCSFSGGSSIRFRIMRTTCRSNRANSERSAMEIF